MPNNINAPDARIAKCLKRANLTDHENNLLIINKHFTSVYWILHFDVSVLHSIPGSQERDNIAPLCRALWAENSLDILTDGLRFKVIKEYCNANEFTKIDRTHI